jgi:hypothetical protein
MKNNVSFKNTKNQTLFIYQIFEHSMFQLACIGPNETTVQNIPVGSIISVKRAKMIHTFLVPIDTVMDTIVDCNSFTL